MASFVIRTIDDETWRQAKSKAALEGVFLKDKIVELITEWVKAAPTKKRKH